jgi:predicted ester cyclase
VTVEDILETEGQAVVRWTARGTHLGDELGITPSGQAVSFRGMTWMRFDDGRLVEGWQVSNIPDVLRSLNSRNGLEA